MNEQAIRFRIGIFVLAALILLAVLIALFAKLPNYFKPSTTYTITFANAPGIGPGTPVRRSGVKIGEVRSLQLDNDTGNVEVQIQVENGFKLRQGDRPTIFQSLLGGDAVISFVSPEGKDVDTTPVEPGAHLTGYAPPDASTLVQKATEAVPAAEQTLVEIKKAAQSMEKVFQKIEQMTPRVDKVLQSVEKLTPTIDDAAKEFAGLAKAVREMVPDLKKSNDEIRELAKSARETVPDLKKTNDEIRELAKSARTVMPDVRKTLDEVQLTARNWGKVGERAEVFIRTNEDKITKTLDRTQDAVKRITDVLSDENQRNIRDTLKNVRAGTERLDSIARNTEDFLKEGRGSLKKINESFTKIDDVLGNVQKATKPIADRGESILKNLDEGTDKMNKAMGDLREIIQVVSRGDGTIQRLLTDPSLFTNLNEVMCSANRMMPRLDHILQDVGIFADRLARHPELIGVRGAIAPSSGIK